MLGRPHLTHYRMNLYNFPEENMELDNYEVE